MMFAAPAVLFLLIIPLGMLIWSWQRKGTAVAIPADHVQGLAPSHRWWQFGLRASEMFPSAIAALAIILLAQPLQPAPPSEKRRMTNIEFCLDVSGSMTANTAEGVTRFEAAMDAIAQFAEARKGDAFGLTIFGNEVLRWLPLTTDLDALSRSKEWLDPDDLPGVFGGTSIGKGLRQCIATLSARGEGDRMLILLSDGRSGDLDDHKAADIAQEMADANIHFFMVFIGWGSPQSEIHHFTSATGGEIFAVNDQAGLQECFAAIDALTPVQIDSEEIGYLPWRQPWLLALAIVGFLQLLGLSFLRRTPW